MKTHPFFWELVEKFNDLMKHAVEGPNCIDPEICEGNCCGIMINVPKVLAQEYINRGFAQKEDFIRADVFSFKLRFDEEKVKCFLFSKDINGCSIHHSGIKPPQCWIYPTNFSLPPNKTVSCKKADGWKIIDAEKAQLAEKLLKQYIFLCQLESRRELKRIKTRINRKGEGRIGKTSLLKEELMQYPPSQLGGFQDTWDRMKVLSAEGLSLQMKKFCLNVKPSCHLAKQNFISCKQICKPVAECLVNFLMINIQSYLKKFGPDSEGKYPLYQLFTM